MGNCLTKKIVTSPPHEGTSLTSVEVRDIIKRAFRIDNDAIIFIGDREYFAYSIDKLQEFLAEDSVNKLTYANERLDCDDFARILQGREREWFSKSTSGSGASTLGCVWGDLRPSEESTEPNYHAMNFFIDSERRVFMIEPQNDEIRLITSNSTHFFVEV
uniref:Agglutinin C-terminal domain-containing protein n=1 Tax=viral metagenome TaxID=1070528 RepID=A0A6C0IX14_9ZZZZ